MVSALGPWRRRASRRSSAYATEAARACLTDGFGRLGLSKIVPHAVPGNTASSHVMERIAVARDIAGDFDLPLPDD